MIFKVDVIILAAGHGSRFKNNIPKQFILLNNKPVIAYPIEVFEKLPFVRQIIVLVNSKYKSLMNEIIQTYKFTKTIITNGDQSASYQTLRNGINLILKTSPPDYVIFHDGVRAMITPEDITKLVSKYQENKYQENQENNFMVGFQIPLTYEVVMIETDGKIKSTPPRSEMAEYHYPLIIPFHILKEIISIPFTIHEQFKHNYVKLAQTIGYQTYLIPGIKKHLIKLTYPEDLVLMEHLMQNRNTKC